MKEKSIRQIKKTTKEVKKKPSWARRNVLEIEELKNYVFERISYWDTQKKIAQDTWYSEQHICKIVKDIEEEFILDVKWDRNKLIAKEIRRLEWITRKIYNNLDRNNNAIQMVSLHNQILKTIEFKTKLQGLLVERAEITSPTETKLTPEEEETLNKLFGE